jgi:hypothetical protein
VGETRIEEEEEEEEEEVEDSFGIVPERQRGSACNSVSRARNPVHF